MTRVILCLLSPNKSLLTGVPVILRYAASSDPAAAHAVQNSLFNFQNTPQPIFCKSGESMR